MDSAQGARQKGNLLVVDDDLTARQTMEALLTREGYDVRLAPNGEMALMVAKEDPPELILLDIRLPDMDGFHVCQLFKGDQKSRDIPVIFISGLDDVVDKVKGFDAGGVDYLTKPFQAEEMLARVGTHLALKRLQKKVEAQNVQLQRARDELEERVKKRTEDLEVVNEQLRTSTKALEERVEFESLLAEISGRFINLPADQVDDEIREAQRRICEPLHVDRSTMWRVPKEDEGTMRLVHIHPVPEGPSLPDRMDAREIFPWSIRKLLSGEVVAISKMTDLPPEATRDLETYRRYSTKSTVSVPLSKGGEKPFGALSFGVTQREQQWSEPVLRGLQLIAQVFANALERKRMQEELGQHIEEIEKLKERLQQENIYLQEEIKLLGEHSEIVGQSLAMKTVLARAEKVAPTESTVLLLGETGTGKELLASAIHRMSVRRDRPLVTINCASLPPTLVESELFGREKGAYTGALTKLAGRFEIADGSTLFLDEIAEFPVDLQSKLLRVLETGDFERLGSTKRVHTDVRIIAATNRDLSREVTEGRFRKDLFYRLNVFPIVIPPLRDRPEDIPLMVWAFVNELQKRMGKEVENISKKSMEALQSYSWPGNARELRNVVERAMIVSSGRTLVIPLPEIPTSEKQPLGSLKDMDRNLIESVLRRTGWRVGGKGGAAEVLGLKRSTLYSKMKKLGIKLDRPTF
jgi:formate hydrogenlyase transcriptional activator